MGTNRFLSVLWDYVIVSFGTLLYCLGWTSFLIPGGIASGGGTGLCTIVYFATGIPVAYSFFVLNTILLIIGFMVLGKAFGFKTIYVILLSTVLFDVLPKFDFLVVTFQDRLFTSIIGGIVEAIGIGIVLTRGGSTGGTDIVALMVNKYWPLSLSTVFFFTDLAICSLLLFVPGKNFSDMCYGLEELVMFSIMVDFVVAGKRSSYQLLVFSEKYREIADHIIHNMNRGVTLLKAQGWYSKQEKNVLLILINQKELPSLTKVIKEADAKAFMSISPTSNVYGEGFDEIKTGVSVKKKSS